MRTPGLSIVVLIVLICIGIFIFFFESRTESYGQDASVRVAAGSLAGPTALYGFDPISKYEEQVEQLEARQEAFCTSCI